MRSTLYASLKDSWYRIPDEAAIYSPDILVFRDSRNVDLPKSERFFTDIISCAAINGPGLIMIRDMDGTKRLEYELSEDFEIMLKKVRLIFQIARQKGISHLVLGAMGCGAYQNPPADVARIFRKVILGDKRAGAVGIEEVVFAIFDDGENLRAFIDEFKDVMA
jgi:uncharacterized protein (TIGR02452 family)